jgi:transposase InsO family protein
MPWSQYTVMDQREELVRFAKLPGANISELCRRFGISRKTAYKWLDRDSFEDRSRRPLNSPQCTDAKLQEQVLQVRDKHPAWGARKIAHVLLRDKQITLAPSTVNSVLRRHGRISDHASAAATPWKRFEHDESNALWQMDFKGHFATATERCHPLTVLDDHSRFNIVLQALGNERRESVQPALQAAFERYGLPQRINTDNGVPWGTPAEPGGLTGLAAWLIRLGVQLSYSRPMHPQTNGKDERFHRTMKAEVLSTREFRDIDEAQRHLAHWRHVYNFERPHEALGMQTPSSRYEPSRRAMPKELPPIEYAEGDLVRKVQKNGWIFLHGHEIRLSKALIGHPVACRPLDDRDGDFAVFFCHHKVAEISLADGC